VVGLERSAFLPLPQDDELLVSLFSIAETEGVSVGIGCRDSAFDVLVGGRRSASFSKNLFWSQLLLDVGEH